MHIVPPGDAANAAKLAAVASVLASPAGQQALEEPTHLRSRVTMEGNQVTARYNTPSHFALRERHYGWDYAPHPEFSKYGFALMPTVFEVMVTPGSRQLATSCRFAPGNTQLANDCNGRSVVSTSSTRNVHGGGIRNRNPLHIRDLPTRQPLTARRNPMGHKRRQRIRKMDSARLGQQNSSNNDSSTSRTRTARCSPGYLTPTISSLAKANPKYPGFQAEHRPMTIYTDNRRRERRCVGPKAYFESDEPEPIVSADTPNQIDVT